MGTELVSVIIPPDKMISDVRHHLTQEAGQAANIKSKSTSDLIAALTPMAIKTIAKRNPIGTNIAGAAIN